MKLSLEEEQTREQQLRVQWPRQHHDENDEGDNEDQDFFQTSSTSSTKRLLRPRPRVAVAPCRSDNDSPCLSSHTSISPADSMISSPSPVQMAAAPDPIIIDGVELPMMPFNALDFEVLVARGPSTSLYRARSHDILLAAKVMPTNGPMLVADFCREIAIVRHLKHPNICRFYGASVGPTSCCLLYEFLDGGSLADVIRDHRRSIDVVWLAKEVACGMAYLHQQGVLHRDLKPSNVLLSRDGKVKVVDFGLSCETMTAGDHTGETGTYRWMAPEVIRHEPYSTAADVYSFGILLWELVAREQPFAGMTPIQAAFAVARQGLRPPMPLKTPLPLANLIRCCWHVDPRARPTFEDVLELLAHCTNPDTNTGNQPTIPSTVPVWEGID